MESGQEKTTIKRENWYNIYRYTIENLFKGAGVHHVSHISLFGVDRATGVSSRPRKGLGFTRSLTVIFNLVKKRNSNKHLK